MATRRLRARERRAFNKARRFNLCYNDDEWWTWDQEMRWQRETGITFRRDFASVRGSRVMRARSREAYNLRLQELRELLAW